MHPVGRVHCDSPAMFAGAYAAYYNLILREVLPNFTLDRFFAPTGIDSRGRPTELIQRLSSQMIAERREDITAVGPGNVI